MTWDRHIRGVVTLETRPPEVPKTAEMGPQSAFLGEFWTGPIEGPPVASARPRGAGGRASTPARTPPWELLRVARIVGRGGRASAAFCSARPRPSILIPTSATLAGPVGTQRDPQGGLQVMDRLRDGGTRASVWCSSIAARPPELTLDVPQLEERIAEDPIGLRLLQVTEARGAAEARRCRGALVVDGSGSPSASPVRGGRRNRGRLPGGSCAPCAGARSSSGPGPWDAGSERWLDGPPPRAVFRRADAPPSRPFFGEPMLLAAGLGALFLCG